MAEERYELQAQGASNSPPYSKLMVTVTVVLLLLLSVLHVITFSSPYPRLKNVLDFFRLFRFYTLYAHLPVLAFGTGLWLVGLALGRWCVRRIASGSDTEFQSWPVALTVGWGVLAYGVMALTLTGVLSIATLSALLFVSALLSFREIIITLRAIPPTLRNACHAIAAHWHSSGTPSRILTVMTGWIGFCSFLTTLMPPTQSDGLRYHLPVPQANLAAGGLAELPHLSFSMFPLTVDMLYTIALAYGVPSGAKLIHYSFCLICLGFIARLSMPGFSRQASVLVFITIPFVPFLSTWTFIEFGLTAFLLLAWYGLRRALECEGRERRAWLLLSALGGGWAMGSKYTSIFNHGLLCLVVMFFLREAWPKRFRTVLLYGMLGTAVASPWYIKNAILTGNPVFPLARGIFGSPGWSDFNNAFYFYHAGEKGSLCALPEMTALEKVQDLATLPIRVSGWPLPGEGFGDWPLGALGLALAPALLLALRYSTFAVRLDAGYAVLLFLFWAYTYRDARFLLPCLAVIAPHLGQTVTNLWSSRPFRLTLTAALVSQGIWMTAMWFDMAKYAPWGVVGGDPVLAQGFKVENFKNPVDAYLAAGTWETIYYYAALLWIDGHLPPEAVLYIHGLHTPFYIPRQAIFTDWFDTEPITDVARNAESPDDLVAWLREQGVTHVLYAYKNINEYNKTIVPYYDLFGLPERQRLDEVEKIRALTIVRFRNYPESLLGYEAERNAIKRAAAGAGAVPVLDKLLNGGLLKVLYDDGQAAVLEVPHL